MRVGLIMAKSKVTLTVDGTPYVPIKLVELKRLRAVEKAAREIVADAARSGQLAKPKLRKLAQAVQR